MIRNDFRNKAVLVTGGTKGLGLAIALAFGKQGAQTYLTYKWGSANMDAVRKTFTDAGAPEPQIIEADASYKEDTVALLETIKQHHDHIEVFVSNVSFAMVGGGFESYKKRSFLKSLEYSAWPMIGYTQQIYDIFGSYPRYVLGTSCDGPERYYPGYDFVAASKAVMETFCKYMAKHLFVENSRINILRSRPISTDSLRATFGEDFEPFLRKWYGDEYMITLEEVGNTALALCSGLMDAMTGQVILLDRGVAFQDNTMRFFEHREEYGVE